MCNQSGVCSKLRANGTGNFAASEQLGTTVSPNSAKRTGIGTVETHISHEFPRIHKQICLRRIFDMDYLIIHQEPTI